MVKNLKEVIQKFSDEKACIQYLVQQRWNGSPVCPYCGCEKWYNIEGGKRFKCGNSACYKKYSVTVGTVFHASNIPLSTWFPAMYILSAHKKGISSIQLAKDLGVTQKTAWFMMHRIRESLKDKDSDLLKGTIEVDETYLAKKFRSDFKGLPEEEITKKMKESHNNKGLMFGMVQRKGKIVVKAYDKLSGEEAKKQIKKHVEKGSTIYSDQSSLYRTGLEDYTRETVIHSRPFLEFVRGDVHVNTLESFWGMMKRGVYGIYHHISYKHLQAYCDEFTYRRNSRQLKDGDRFELALCNLEGRLTYNRLVYGQDSKPAKEEGSQTS